MIKYRIAYTTPSSKIAGTEKSLMLLLKNMNREAFDNYVICFAEGPFVDLLNKNGFKVTIIKRKSRKSLFALIKLVSFLKRNKIDLLYECSSRFDALSAKIIKIPVVERQNMTRDCDQLFINRISIIDKISAKFLVDKILAVSYAIKNQLIRRGIDNKNIVTVYNGVQKIRNKDVDINQIRNELGVKQGYKIVSIVGRLCRQKGHLFFLKAVPEIVKNYIKVQFLVAGDGPLREGLVKVVKSLNIEEHVKFLGFYDNINDIYIISDIIVVPSLWEPLANVALEAMAACRPVISTKVDGMEEIVINNQTGILIPPGDSKSISDAVLDILKDKIRATQLAYAGYQNIIKNFSVEKMIMETEKLFVTCLEQKVKNENPH